jgi:hypothetical protein
VIAAPPGVRILLAARPVDFRKGMDGLAALVQQALRADPFAGDVFIGSGGGPGFRAVAEPIRAMSGKTWSQGGRLRDAGAEAARAKWWCRPMCRPAVETCEIPHTSLSLHALLYWGRRISCLHR